MKVGSDHAISFKESQNAELFVNDDRSKSDPETRHTSQNETIEAGLRDLL